MVRILSVGTLGNLPYQHNEALRKAGFTVSSCKGLPRAKRLLGRPERYDVLLFGEAVSERQRNWLTQYVQELSPTTRILQAENTANPAATERLFNAALHPEEFVQTVRCLAQAALALPESSTVSNMAFVKASRKVLYIASTTEISLLRQHQLKAAGYDAYGAVTIQEVEAACENVAFDLVVMGPAVGPRVKLRIAGAVRERRPRARLLETGTVDPAIKGADSTLGVSGQDLLKAIEAMLAQERLSVPQYPMPDIKNKAASMH